MTTNTIATTTKIPTPIPALKIPSIAEQLVSINENEKAKSIFLKLFNMIFDL